MSQVFRIMVSCPATKQNIDTGIITSGREVLNTNIYEGTVSCPYCGQFHRLDGNAFLQVEDNLTTDSLWRPNP